MVKYEKRFLSYLYSYDIKAWNGVAFVIEYWFKNNLKDSKSLEIIEVTEIKKG